MEYYGNFQDFRHVLDPNNVSFKPMKTVFSQNTHSLNFEESDTKSYFPQTKYPFYESNSKYISLKLCEHYKQSQNKHPLSKKSQNKQEVKVWFEELSLTEKSLALTVIDQQLVKLILIMYQYVQDHQNGQFCNSNYPLEKQNCIKIQDQYQTINLFFIKPKNFNSTTQTLKAKEQGEQTIVYNVRIFSVNNDGVMDGLTFDTELFKNTQYFFELIKKTQNNNFLYSHYEICEDLERLQQNPFFDPEKYKSKSKQSNSVVFLSKYQEQKASKDNTLSKDTSTNSMSLAQCILSIFEKAINVHYKHAHSQFTPNQVKALFITDPLFQTNILDLANFWLQSDEKQKNAMIEQITTINDKLIVKDHLEKQELGKIQEVESNEENDSYFIKQAVAYPKHQRKEWEHRNDSQHYYQKQFRSYYNGSSEDDEEGENNMFKQKPFNAYFDEFDYEHNVQKNNNELMKSPHNQLSKIKNKIIQLSDNTSDSVYALMFLLTADMSLELHRTHLKTKKYPLEYQFHQEFKKHIMQVKKSNLDDYFDTLPSTSTSKQDKSCNKKNKQLSTSAQNQSDSKKLEKKNKQSVKPDVEELKAKIKQKNEGKQLKQAINQIVEEETNLLRRKEEKTSLLTGAYLDYKYKDEDDLEKNLSNNGNIDNDNGELKKKKKKKNKKKNKKKKTLKDTEEEKEQQQLAADGDYINRLFMANSVPKQQTISEIGVRKESDQMESLDLIQLTEEARPIGMMNKEKKVNNFIEEVKVETYNQELVEDYQSEMRLRHKKEQEEEDVVRNYVEGTVQEIFDNVYVSFSEEPVKQKKQEVEGNSEQVTLTNKKKKKNKKNKNKQQNKLKSENVLSKSPTEVSIQKVSKKVDFLIRDSKSIDNDSVAIPKRGSSKGSSGNEEILHQNMIDSLDELFPSSHKQPKEPIKLDVHTIKSIKEEKPDMLSPINKGTKGADNKHSSKVAVEEVKTQKKKGTQQQNQKQKVIQEEKPIQEDITQIKKKNAKKAKIVQVENFENYQTMFQKQFESQTTKNVQVQQQQDSNKHHISNSQYENRKQSNAQKQNNNAIDKQHLREKGQQVNPDVIKKANKKNKKAQQHVYDQTSITVTEQRSQTPNVETQALEPSVSQKQKAGVAVHSNTQNKSKKSKQQNQLHQLLEFDQLNKPPVQQQLSNRNYSTQPQHEQNHPQQLLDQNKQVKQGQGSQEERQQSPQQMMDQQQMFMNQQYQMQQQQQYMMNYQMPMMNFQQNFSQQQFRPFQQQYSPPQQIFMPPMNSNPNFIPNYYQQVPFYNQQIPYNHPIDQDQEFYQQLEQEILTLTSHYKTLIKSVENERQKVFELLNELIHDIYHSDVKSHVYGSMATGLAIDSSDMDILVTGLKQKHEHANRQTTIQEMNKLHQQLESFFSIVNNSLIDTASVPVIKIKLDLSLIRNKYFNQDEQAIEIDEKLKFLKIDITFNEGEMNSYINQEPAPIHLGIQCCTFIQSQLELYPILHPLVIVLKKFLAVNNLNSPFFGGLSSYGLILLIISFIKEQQQYNYGFVSIGHTFSNFLYYYGSQFHPMNLIVNEDTRIVNSNSQYHTLTILDPLNPINNIGKSTYNFDQIQKEFMKAFSILEFNKQLMRQKRILQQFMNAPQQQSDSNILAQILKVSGQQEQQVKQQ